jgi:hypothetical protein
LYSPIIIIIISGGGGCVFCVFTVNEYCRGLQAFAPVYNIARERKRETAKV